MKNIKRQAIGIVAAALATCLLPLAGAEARSGQRELLDRSGNFFQIRAVTYAEAVPDGSAIAPETPVLSLEITPASGECRRELVPRSMGWEADTEERLFLEPYSNSIVVLWVVKGWGSDEIRVASYRDGAWVADERISFADAAGRQNVDAILNRQLVQPADGFSGLSTIYTLLQLTWWESFPWGGGAPRYGAVFFNNDGSVDKANLGVYDPTVTEGHFGQPCAEGATPTAAYFPGVERESLAGARITAFSESTCRFLVVPVSFVSYPADGDTWQQARHIPFIGFTSKFDVPNALPVAALDSGFDASGDVDGGYVSAVSWVSEGSFYYVTGTPVSAGRAGSTWSETRRIPLGGDVDVARAREMVRSLLAAD